MKAADPAARARGASIMDIATLLHSLGVDLDAHRGDGLTVRSPIDGATLATRRAAAAASTSA
jgi:aldehyde dehydrogenase (NAD+)